MSKQALQIKENIFVYNSSQNKNLGFNETHLKDLYEENFKILLRDI